MMKKHFLVWERLDEKTLEYCTVYYSDSIKISGNITGLVSNIPVHVNYFLTLNSDWQITAFDIEVLTDSDKKFSLTKNENGNWVDKTEDIKPEFSACNDIDISLTPLTNTLPIRRLHLKENESKEIKVLYVDVIEGKLKVSSQRYTNLGNNKYFYEGLDSGFKAELNINDDGFVTQYSIYWRLLKFK